MRDVDWSEWSWENDSHGLFARDKFLTGGQASVRGLKPTDEQM
ncbi:multidrug ABC transporter ATPase [Streptococcus anginosus]|nr:multidrug ABC transporter ATPase [Streptococcus anginosus]